jgi:SET domain-containing protein
VYGGDLEHPRYGLIVVVQAIRDIKADEELFTDYGYGDNGEEEAFEWYYDMKRDFDREIKEKAQAEARAELEKAEKAAKEKGKKGKKKKKKAKKEQ